MRGIEKVFHLAALYRVSGIPERAYHEVHVGGTANLLKAAKVEGVRRFVHCIDDLVRGFLLAADADAAVGEVLIVGGEEVLTLNQLLDRIAATLGASGRTLHFPARPFQLLGSMCEAICRPFGLAPPLYRRRVDFFTKSRAFCIDKAKRVLGYRPQVTLQEGLAGTAASYRALGLI